MILNSNFVFERSFYLSTVPGVRYKESIPEGILRDNGNF